MPSTARLAVGLLLAATASGCLGPRTFRTPTVRPRSIPYERAESRVHDPFPRDDVGPETSMRPPGFSQPRVQERSIRERTGLSGLRREYGRPLPPVFPLGQQPGYYGAVR